MPFYHSVCGARERDAYNLNRKEGKCQVCNAVMMGKVYPRATVVALRKELAATRRQLQQLLERVPSNCANVPSLCGTKRTVEPESDEESVKEARTEVGELTPSFRGTKRTVEPDTSESDEESVEEAHKEVQAVTTIEHLPPQKPKPMSITVRGDDTIVPGGVYMSYGGAYKDMYVLQKEILKCVKEEGRVQPSLLMKPVLTFKYIGCRYHLVVQKSAEHDSFHAMEKADKSWRVETGNDWVAHDLLYAEW